MTDRNTLIANLVHQLMRYGDGEDQERYIYGVEVRRDPATAKQTVFFRMQDRHTRKIHTMEEAISDTSLRLYGNQYGWIHRIATKFTERWEYFKKMGVFPPKDSHYGVEEKGAIGFLEAVDPDDMRAVDEFSKEMKLELLKNSHKGGWLSEDVGSLLRRLKMEVRELEEAIIWNDGIVEEAADVANFVMMIADHQKCWSTNRGRVPDGLPGIRDRDSMSLPKDHWIYESCSEPPMPFKLGIGESLRRCLSERIVEAAKYAVRGATMSGTDMDFDPDAVIQNLIVGLFGYHTKDGSKGGELIPRNKPIDEDDDGVQG
jgi:hypothetical protein